MPDLPSEPSLQQLRYQAGISSARCAAADQDALAEGPDAITSRPGD